MNSELSDYEIGCEWSQAGLARLAPQTDVLIIIDVLSFTTAVEVAVSRGATVYPYRWHDESAVKYAESVGAVLAGPKREAGYSLSPASLVKIPAGVRLVLPSPNGSTLSKMTEGLPTFAGCFRNAGAVAKAALLIGKRVSVIPAGERWTDGSLRVAIEDWLAAGAIISYLKGTRSVEAQMAANAFEGVRHDLLHVLMECVSGRELIEKGFTRDVELAADLDASTTAPRLIAGAFAAT